MYWKKEGRTNEPDNEKASFGEFQTNKKLA
jgi:hypothetical protein